MMLYLDTSALVKLYVDEDDSAAVRRQVDTASRVATSLLSWVLTSTLIRSTPELTLALDTFRLRKPLGKCCKLVNRGSPTFVKAHLFMLAAFFRGLVHDTSCISGSSPFVFQSHDCGEC